MIALLGCPHRYGIVLRAVIVTPRKPNSARRKAVWVRLSSGYTVLAYVPGIGHTLSQHSGVLVRAGGGKDVPGIKYSAVRGVHDLGPVVGRRSSRSKYGCPRQ